MCVSIHWRLMILLMSFGAASLVLITSNSRAGIRQVTNELGTEITDRLIVRTRTTLAQVTYEQTLLVTYVG